MRQVKQQLSNLLSLRKLNGWCDLLPGRHLVILSHLPLFSKYSSPEHGGGKLVSTVGSFQQLLVHLHIQFYTKSNKKMIFLFKDIFY